jgi:hypothetical protein
MLRKHLDGRHAQDAIRRIGQTRKLFSLLQQHGLTGNQSFLGAWKFEGNEMLGRDGTHFVS